MTTHKRNSKEAQTLIEPKEFHMQTQSKSKGNDKVDSFVAPPKMAKTADVKRLKGLLEEAVAQLDKTADEYHSELAEKIRLELGMNKEQSVSDSDLDIT